MGDTCCDAKSIGGIRNHIKSRYPGIVVHSIALGKSRPADLISGYFGSLHSQINEVCNQLLEMRQLERGFVGIGFSQGGQFFRALVQRCQGNGLNVHSLITLGSQHQGIMDDPGCRESRLSILCRAMQSVLGVGAYLPGVQSFSIQAQYFKDPNRLDVYAHRSGFLADINAEADPPLYSVYSQYRQNLASLKKLVLFQFEEDDMVVPKESAHFGFFDGNKVIPLNESRMWIEDTIGLRTLHEKGGLMFDFAPGRHMQFTLDWFDTNVVQPYALVHANINPA
jgi:palmitoyl-protein thioesterase